jgi:hypothetical protein
MSAHPLTAAAKSGKLNRMLRLRTCPFPPQRFALDYTRSIAAIQSAKEFFCTIVLPIGHAKKRPRKVSVTPRRPTTASSRADASLRTRARAGHPSLLVPPHIRADHVSGSLAPATCNEYLQERSFASSATRVNVNVKETLARRLAVIMHRVWVDGT